MQSKKPRGCREYRGSYSVLIGNPAANHYFPGEVSVHGSTVSVRDGRFNVLSRGIQFHADGRPFFLSYAVVREIRDGKGHLLWKNKGN